MGCLFGFLVCFIFNDLLTHLLICHTGIWIFIQYMLKNLILFKRKKKIKIIERDKHNGKLSKFSEGDRKYMVVSDSRKHGISCSLGYILAFFWQHFRQQNAFGMVSLYAHPNRRLLQVLPAPQIKSRDSTHNAGMSKINMFLVQGSKTPHPLNYNLDNSSIMNSKQLPQFLTSKTDLHKS